ncbi:MAG: thiamine-phosphate kinase [Bacteroidales bacterium]|nr:thiamine-phosphate kinase [Bacteroidales bacterium]
MEQQKPQRTEFSQIGHRAAVARLFEGSGYTNSPEIKIADGIASHKLMAQGVDFDLVYNPLKHLGYKAVLNVLGEIYAAFHRPRALSLAVGVSSHFAFEDIAELWGGVLAAAKEHGIKELHLDLFPSINGLQISLMATGAQSRTVAGKIPAASSKDLICLSGNVGAAYMGQHVLEREKGAFLAAGEENAKQPDLSKYKYLLSQYLCPEIPANVIDRFAKGGFYPTAGVFDCRGLAEAVNSLCEKTGFGAKLYLDRLPIASETFEMAAEVNIDAVTAAINGGDDYRLIYTIPLSRYEEFKREIQTFDVIGHLAHSDVGSVLVTPDGAELPLREI